MNDSTVAYDFVPSSRVDSGRVVVSTVELSFNHATRGGPPLWFETMVFKAASDTDEVSSYMDLDCKRYETREDAIEGHKGLVAEIQSGEWRGYDHT